MIVTSLSLPPSLPPSLSLSLSLSLSPSYAVKIWNQLWILQYAFISHQSPVTSLTPYPNGPCIISGSLDGTLRLWNLFHWDKMQEIDHCLPVHGLYSEPGHSKVLSRSSKQVRTWEASELYKRIAIVGWVGRLSRGVALHIIGVCSERDGPKGVGWSWEKEAEQEGQEDQTLWARSGGKKGYQ